MDKEFDNFEKALNILKSTVEKLELGNMSDLDELIKNYENGMSAYTFCMEKLESTEKKIKVIDNNLSI